MSDNPKLLLDPAADKEEENRRAGVFEEADVEIDGGLEKVAADLLREMHAASKGEKAP